MQSDLLNSVVKITRKRDVDSLELSLLSTINEFIPCDHLILYKNLAMFNGKGIEKSAELITREAGEYTWSTHSIEKQPHEALLRSLDSGCSITICDAQDTEERWLPISINEKVLGAIYIKASYLASENQVIVTALCRIYENYLAILNESERDTLTGLLNRQTFDRKIKRLMENQLQSHQSMAAKSVNKDEARKVKANANSWLAILDIDHFKQVNDTYGHVCGDEVLLYLAQILQRSFRSNDLVFRFGGEEFVIVFEPSEQKDIAARLESFKKSLAETKFPFVEQLTVSIGYTRMSPYDFPLSVFENADKALYHAKRTGRNKIVYYGDIQDELNSGKEIDSDIELF